MAKSTASTTYRGKQLDRVAFPLGGLGAGMLCLEGTGALSHVSLHHNPDVYNEPMTFAALHVKGAKTARVLEGRVPSWKLFFPWDQGFGSSGNGLGGKTYGLPRFGSAAFQARFPFGRVQLTDPTMPVTADLTGWSPFMPNDADASSLPVAAVEYRFRNPTRRSVQAVFSFHAVNFMGPRNAPNPLPAGALPPSMRRAESGFVFEQAPWPEKPAAAGAFTAFVLDEAATSVDCGWFRGGWFDPLTMAWNAVATGQTLQRSPHAEGGHGRGASLYVPFTMPAGGEHTVRLLFAWYMPVSDYRMGGDACAPTDGKCCCQEMHRPWYASRFQSLDDVATHWRTSYGQLREQSKSFSDCFHDTTLPPEAVDAAGANLSILKSPTCLRQADGRFWAWEGCLDSGGCCHGTCTHVWNYAQSMPHLFPVLERGLRETEYLVSQDKRGHQNFRSSLPIRPPDHNFHAAADGQLGGLVKLYRDWRISGDTVWMQSLWPAARRSLEYGIETWDPDRTGLLVEPHHNTYDIEFWGADGMCTSFYLAALQAAVLMGQACDDDVGAFQKLLAKGKRAVERKLWNGHYFIQKVQWQGLRAGDPTKTAPGVNATVYTPEAQALLQREGPKYQYGTGCLSDGVLGDWMARVSGVPAVLDAKKAGRHLDAIFAHNFRKDLSDHANPQRPGYAANDEAGLLLCSWPKGGKPALPFPYSDEVWTGIEYQVAAHLIMLGRMDKGLAIVRAARSRYDGRTRNPFNEYECGHWYARAMSSYSLLQALGGARYDAVEQVLYLEPAIRGDYRAFLCTATGYGTVGVRKGKPFIEVKSGAIPVKRIEFNCVCRTSPA